MNKLWFAVIGVAVYVLVIGFAGGQAGAQAKKALSDRPAVIEANLEAAGAK